MARLSSTHHAIPPAFPASMKMPRAVLGSALALLLLTRVHAEVLIERTWLPHDAGPSSFAIGLPGNVSFCFDPTRGGLSYAWTGGFIDITPARPGTGKLIKPVTLPGPVVYRETGASPLRREPTRAPTFELKGYTLHDDRVEFRYTVDGVLVHEEIVARSDASGLTRRFRMESANDAAWWYVVDGQPATELQRGTSGRFALEVPFGKASP
jgi:hypothetical protein